MDRRVLPGDPHSAWGGSRAGQGVMHRCYYGFGLVKGFGGAPRAWDIRGWGPGVLAEQKRPACGSVPLPGGGTCSMGVLEHSQQRVGAPHQRRHRRVDAQGCAKK